MIIDQNSGDRVHVFYGKRFHGYIYIVHYSAELKDFKVADLKRLTKLFKPFLSVKKFMRRPQSHRRVNN